MSVQGRRYHVLLRRTRALRVGMALQHWTRHEQHEFIKRLVLWEQGFDDPLLKKLIKMFDAEVVRTT